MNASPRTVMITGGAGHLGRAVAAAFAAEGANRVLVDLRRESLEQAFGPGDERTLLLAADLLDAGAAARAASAARQRFGRIDALCNLAGGFAMGDAVHETGDDTWQRVFGLNVHTLRHAVSAVVPAMIEAGGGAIVNVGAAAARRGQPKMGAYIAAKDAVQRLTESMAAELREHGVRVNCVLPSVIDTPDNRDSMPDADPAHWVAPRDLAAVIVFLASDAARAVSGAALPVTGGR